MNWNPSKHQTVKVGWLKGLQKRTNLKDLFCYFDKEYEAYFLAIWKTPKQRYSEYSIVEAFGNQHPRECSPPEDKQVASVCRFFADIKVQVMEEARDKRKQELRARVRKAEHGKDLAKWFQKKGLFETAQRLRTGEIPVADPQGEEFAGER